MNTGRVGERTTLLIVLPSYPRNPANVEEGCQGKSVNSYTALTLVLAYSYT